MLIFAHLYNRHWPRRFRLSNADMIYTLVRARSIKLKELVHALETMMQEWRKLFDKSPLITPKVEKAVRRRKRSWGIA